MEWTTTLKCNKCGTEVRFENERPNWKEDPEVAAAMVVAKAFVERHKDKLPCHVENKPPYVFSTGQYGELKVINVDPRYVDCPCCEGRAWFGSGKQATA